MEKFIARHAVRVSSVLSGFDRLVFRGYLRLLRYRGMRTSLDRAGVRLLDFGTFAQATTERVKRASLAEAERTQRPVVYLESSRTSKEDLARELLAKHPLAEPGLICALTTVEPCMRFEYHRSPNPTERGRKRRPSKCLHVYKYYRIRSVNRVVGSGTIIAKAGKRVSAHSRAAARESGLLGATPRRVDDRQA